MSNDHEGIVHDPRIGQQQGDSRDTQGIDEEISDQPGKDSKSTGGREENQPRDRGSQELIAAANLIKNASDEDLIEAGIISKSETEMMSVAYSGMLPHPSIYKMYDDETRERMCRWNDAYTIDESKRQDKLVDSEIKVRNRAQWISTLLMVAAFACAVVTYVIYQNTVLSCAFIAVPFITVLANGIQSVRPKNKSDNDQLKED